MTILKCEGVTDAKDPASLDKVIEVMSRYLDKKATKTKAQRVLLDLLPAEHEKFRPLLIEYLRPQFIKGVMSAINEIKVYYKEAPAKADIIGEILTAMNDSMEANMTLSPDDEEEQDPTVQLWLYYYLSQHYMRKAERADATYFAKAFEFINKAIEHTPTVVELYLHKAKLHQRVGNTKAAARLTEEARKLDLQDRYVNAHSAKYLLKDNQLQAAYDTMMLFSRDIEEGKFNVHEMAQNWYEWHRGRANLRQGELR